jgi:hypothetical protein
MYTFLLMAHSGWRYIAFLVLVVAILKYGLGWIQRSRWSNLDRQIGLATVIGVDIQVLLGIVLWAVAAGMGLVAGRVERMMEHPVLMLIAVVVMHIGWARVRKTSGDADKHRVAALTFIVTGLIVALSVARVTGWM